MSHRPVRSCLCFSLLAFLWSGTPASSSEPTVLTSEAGGVALSSHSDSTIPVDEAALAELVCGGGGVDEEYGPTAQCKSIARNIFPGPGGIQGLQLPPQDPLRTPCGQWGVQLKLSRPFVNSSIVLTEVPGDPGRGVFAGVFAMDAFFELTNLETGETVELSERFDFGVAGPWAVSTPDKPPADDNVMLLADRLEDKLVPFESCVKVTIGPGCVVCLTSLLTESPSAGIGEIQ